MLSAPGLEPAALKAVESFGPPWCFRGSGENPGSLDIGWGGGLFLAQTVEQTPSGAPLSFGTGTVRVKTMCYMSRVFTSPMPQVCGIRNMAPWCRGVSASGSQVVPGRCRRLRDQRVQSALGQETSVLE